MKYRFIIFLLMALTLAGCKAKRRVVDFTTPVAEKRDDALFKDILAESFPYETLSARMDLKLTNGTRARSSKAQIRIVKDNALQISIQPLFGVELFRLYVDPDTIALLDRMEKRYVKEAITTLKGHYPVGFDFYTLQSLFTNTLFVANKAEVTPADFRRFSYTRTPDSNYYLTAKDPKSEIEYSFSVNGDNRVTYTHLKQSEEESSLQWSYSHFIVLNQSAFPHTMRASITSGDRVFNTEFLFSDVVTNDGTQLSLQIPASYTRTSLDDILKIIADSR